MGVLQKDRGGREGRGEDRQDRKKTEKKTAKITEKREGEVEMVSIEKRQRREAEVTFSPAPTDQFLSPVPASTSLS